MKLNLIPFIILFIFCSSYIDRTSGTQERDLYTVYKIDSVNTLYLIYCKKGDEKYKIFSKKTNNDKLKQPVRIDVGHSYKLRIKPFPGSDSKNPLENDILLVNCFTVAGTKICREDSLGLYQTNNLMGLYYVNDTAAKH